jgi:plastocyanin
MQSLVRVSSFFLVGSIIFLAGCGESSTPGTLGDPRAGALDAHRTPPQGTPKPTTTPVAPTPKPAVKPATTPTKIAPKTYTIAIKNGTFSPSMVFVERGTIVTWINYDGSAHTVTGDAGGPASSNLGTGKKYSYTFNEIGNFNYHCTVHPMMKATVSVTPATK